MIECRAAKPALLARSVHLHLTVILMAYAATTGNGGADRGIGVPRATLGAIMDTGEMH